MGEHTETIAIGVGQCRSCEAHHVGVSPQEDRGCSKSAVGQG
jgi:hypothetical protein